jgi:hypothetical protein
VIHAQSSYLGLPEMTPAEARAAVVPVATAKWPLVNALPEVDAA